MTYTFDGGKRVCLVALHNFLLHRIVHLTMSHHKSFLVVGCDRALKGSVFFRKVFFFEKYVASVYTLKMSKYRGGMNAFESGVRNYRSSK